MPRQDLCFEPDHAILDVVRELQAAPEPAILSPARSRAAGISTYRVAGSAMTGFRVSPVGWPVMETRPMHGDGPTWALVLAAGEGSRLRSLTTTDAGTSIPKQFCSLRDGPSLVQEALVRAQMLTLPRNVCAIVAAQHERWWLPQLASLPAANIFVQPLNRGTANGILLPLLLLLERDPGARVVLLPSDHHVQDEAILARSMRKATEQLHRGADEVLLLGLEPDEADPQLGYIVPDHGGSQGNLRVVQFVEKPTTMQARQLISHGALWNTFIVASTARALLKLLLRSVPGIVKAMQTAVRQDLQSHGKSRAVAQLYDRLPGVDFSRDILAEQFPFLRVLAVPPCGWSDLGTPERVERALHGFPRPAELDSMPGPQYLSLAAQQERLRANGLGQPGA
ncbi:MAG: sugar phosphate nucleotidyltransferase [Steroidobacterales bacterium]